LAFKKKKMRISTLLLPVLFLSASSAFSQDTFSIVAADSTTREVGSAGASCVDLFQFGIIDATFLGDLLPDTGAINTQASYLAGNQNNARTRMRAGDTPSQVISWLAANDIGSNSTIRQYGIAGFSGANVSAAGFTGTNCQNYKNHVTGSINGIYYSIQGNILLGQLVLDSMESRFRNAQGDIACRLMAALQGAKMVGADTRCTTNNTSSLFAFLKVSQPTDTYGNPSFKISVKTHNNDSIEPIDSLQTIFTSVLSCTSVGIVEMNLSSINIYPNPAGNELMLRADPALAKAYFIIDPLGRQVLDGKITEENTVIPLAGLSKGIYLVQVGVIKRKFIKN